MGSSTPPMPRGFPGLVGLSLTTLRYVGLEYVAGLVPAARNQATVPLYFHLDHGADLDDVLACSFGNKPAGGVGIGSPDRGLFARIGRASPVPLVVHGGTSLTDDMIRFAIGCGAAKVNIDTWIRRAVTQTLARCYAGGDYPADPRLSFKQVRAAVADAVAGKLRLFTAGRTCRGGMDT